MKIITGEVVQYEEEESACCGLCSGWYGKILNEFSKYLMSKRCSSCCDDDLEEITVELPVEVEMEPAAAAEDHLLDGEDIFIWIFVFYSISPKSLL